ncbi:MAG TPA: oligosaccharide flippase family protein [Coleofasciculaceae cyanobacterium]
MLKQLLKDSIIYGISSIFSRGITLLMVPLYTRVLSPGDYGIIEILTIVTNLVNLSIALEISQGLAIYYSSAKTDSDRVEYASTALYFTIITNSLFLIVALSLSQKLSLWILGSSNLQTIFQAAVISMWGNGIFYLLQSQLRWQLKPKGYAVSSIVFSLVSTGLTTILLFVFKVGVIGVFYSLFTGQIVGIVLAGYFVRHSYKLKFNWQKCKQMLGFSIPLVFSSISVWVALYIDRIAINQLMTLSDVGIYGIGYRFASVAGLFLIGFQGALTPLIFHNYEKPDTPKELARVFRYFLALVLPMIVGISVFSHEILSLFTTPDYYAASQIIPLLALAIILSNMYIFTPGIDLAKKTLIIAVVNIISAIANTILSFTLIPYLGISGAALATLLSAAATFAIYMKFSQKFYYIPHQWNKIISATIVATFLGITGFAIGAILVFPKLLILTIKFFLIIVCIGLLSYLLLDIQELKTLTQSMILRMKR